MANIERRVIAVLKCMPWTEARIVAEDDDTLTVTRGGRTWTLSKTRDRYMIAERPIIEVTSP